MNIRKRQVFVFDGRTNEIISTVDLLQFNYLMINADERIEVSDYTIDLLQEITNHGMNLFVNKTGLNITRDNKTVCTFIKEDRLIFNGIHFIQMPNPVFECKISKWKTSKKTLMILRNREKTKEIADYINKVSRMRR